MVAQEVLICAPDKEFGDRERKFQDISGEPMVTDEVEPSSALMNSQFCFGALKTPRQIYYEQVERETDSKLKEALTNLFETGFTNFEINKMLMIKHRDINVVANTLISGELSQSQFAAMLN